MPPNCVLDDDGQKIAFTNSTSDGSTSNLPSGAFDCTRPHFHDVAEFLADVHTLTKLKVDVGTHSAQAIDSLMEIFIARIE